MRICFRSLLLARLFVLLFCLSDASPTVRAGIELDYLMDSDPDLPAPEPVEDFNPAMSALWMEALARPEIDFQRMAAETIARAHQFGIPNLARAVPRLEAILLDDASHPAARYAAVRALVVLDSQSSAEKLFQASQSFGADLRQLIEPALAAWGDSSAKTIWTARLGSSETRYRDLILAIRSLGQLRDPSALPDLIKMIGDTTRTPDCRIEAATAAGLIAENNLESIAERLAQNTTAPPFVDQVCALRLLSRHESEAAQQLLIDLASHHEPVVAGGALRRLNEIDFSLVLPLTEVAVHHSDPEVRRQGAICLLERPAVDRIGPLSQLLTDPHPGLRREVCEGLLRLADDPELEGPIRDAAMRVLSGDSWEGQEQAALLLGSLEYKPAADRLIELLTSPRAEVSVTVAWALRKVAVESAIPAMIEQATRLTEQGQHDSKPGISEQICHLFEALAVLNAQDATPLMLQYVPKKGGWRLPRGAAIWALGRLNSGVRNPEIESALADRIMDFDPQPSETKLVKEMSAIALGRMQAVDQVPMLRRYANSNGVHLRLDLALGWAVKELTGEELPPPEPLPIDQGSWFLEPLP